MSGRNTIVGCGIEDVVKESCKLRGAGFEPALPAWEADVLDQTGRTPRYLRWVSSTFLTFQLSFWEPQGWCGKCGLEWGIGLDK